MYVCIYIYTCISACCLDYLEASKSISANIKYLLHTPGSKFRDQWTAISMYKDIRNSNKLALSKNMTLPDLTENGVIAPADSSKSNELSSCFS